MDDEGKSFFFAYVDNVVLVLLLPNHSIPSSFLSSLLLFLLCVYMSVRASPLYGGRKPEKY